MADNEYEKFVALIEDVEGTAKKTDASFIDISQLVDQQASSNKKSYKDIIDIITEVESGGRRPREAQTFREQAIPQQVQVQSPKQQKQQQQQKKQENVQSHAITAGVAQSQYSQQGAVLPKVEQEKKPFSFFGREKEKKPEETKKTSAGIELGAIAEKLGSIKTNIPDITRKRINTKYLVLPNLSIADQISELERITEGLKENVFDPDHIDIVVQEIYGLQQVVNDAKKKSKKEELNSLEQSLWELRDQRLAEAISLLQRNGVK